jgi:fused signal recognition particle receptor
MKHLLSKLKSGLQKTRRQLSDNVERVLAGRTKVDEELLEELEEVLIGGDVGVSTAEKLIRRLRERIREEKIDTGEAVGEALRQEIGSVLRRGEAEEPPHGEGPRVVLVVGVNGTGKTTTLGKLAHRYRSGGKRVLVAAADTFRAAAVDQLRVWADRAGAEIVANAAGADPAAVAFDAVCAARSRGMDIVLVDTAGRLQTKVNLMEELGKIGRVVGKALPGAPHEVLLVLDATTGQNAVRQAQQFGVVVAISDQLGIPVQFLGLGEAMEDLEPFDAEAFASALFEEEATGPAGAEIPS